MECAWQVEIDDYCTKVLTKHWPEVPKFRDIRECGKHNLSSVDLVCGGFPCQSFSVAGKRKGKKDDRYLWPEMFRVIQELKPTWVFGENVTGIINMALDTVLSDLEGCGYSCQTFIIPACAVNAPHRRDRIWIVGHSPQFGRDEGETQEECEGTQENVADSEGRRLPKWSSKKTVQYNVERGSLQDREDIGQWWDIEPNVGRVAHGVPARVDRLKFVEVIGQAIMQANRGGER
jgi:DNA (cytosine-5)-methyltransferase 1